ncbi:type IV toxin-antitoxin system AbiEi family antitoxin [Cupriavidus sp. D39]|uniref:type IV toxin-antitoxin system AbiEi family antitoxin n=1 Tax=Cupriavidus sp. D39 TaxID=2997877 RepID=UPI00226D99B4|nr:type IV toxin-antitoxin system AbiEi family antitoxin [Cupriavidus sp. D39]MCY0858785.1 type IV toxin-antitoxin system AbiEi family antitoxin [Cupriavidus sp. D39]
MHQEEQPVVRREDGKHARLVTQFVQALQEATGADVTPQADSASSVSELNDRLLSMATPDGETWQLVLELLREGYPRDVRRVVWKLNDYLDYRHDSATPPDLIPVVVADHLSSGAREDLRQQGIGYFDSSGTLFLRHRKWLINIDRPSKPGATRHTPDLFKGAREKVIHALLHAEQHWRTGLQLADESETSAYTVSTVLHELDRLEWVESQGSGRTLRRRLTKPGLLLDAWANAWRDRKESKSRWHFYSANPNAILAGLTAKFESAELRDWAFTGTAAANTVSPLLTRTETAEVIVPPDSAEQYAEAIGLKRAEKGSNVTLVERSGASMLFRRLHSDNPSWIASPFVLYLDLLDERGRNAELAAQLRHDILKI